MKERIGSAQILRLLKSQYPRECGRTAPFAFWKMRAIIEGGEGYFLPEHGCHYLIYRNHLMYYASPDGACHIPPEELNRLDAISLPASMYDAVSDGLDGFEAHYGWGLRYDLGYVPPAAPSGWEAVDFDFGCEGDYALAAQIISGGEGDWMTAARVRRMAGFEAFDPSLWFFVREAGGRRVAVAISAYSPEVAETDLDWIFVLPGFQGRGTGRFLLREVIRRCAHKSDLIRVGGTEEFYRRCGFVNDVRWVWAAKPGYRFTCERIQP